MDEHDDEVFKALGDANRRRLLDLLFERDGQALSELQEHLPMTRFGVMKHLQILENAGLITTRKVGREKLHYLNPIPIQMVFDRWVRKYARPFTRTLTGLKYALEVENMAAKPSQVFSIFIRTTPEKLWQALTDGELTHQYYDGCRVESTWLAGAAYRYVDPQGNVVLEGEVLEIDPPRRLVTTFRPLWTNDEIKHPSKLTYEIETTGSAS
jgi:DNA-binding transcriptional ArsR family regulator